MLLTFGLSRQLLALVILVAFVLDILSTLANVEFYLETSPRCKPHDTEDRATGDETGDQEWGTVIETSQGLPD